MSSWIRFQPTRWLVLLMSVLALALVIAACAPEEPDEVVEEDPEEEPEPDEEPDEEPDDEPEEEPAEVGEGGTVVWAYDQEPGTLNPAITDGNLYATSQIALSVLQPLWVITPDFEYEPSVLLDDVEVDEDGDPFSVTYFLNEDANWSDGEPVTAGDVFFTIEVNLDPDIDITSRAGYDEVDVEMTEEELDPDSKEITVYFQEPYAPWQTMFSIASGVIFPEHILADHTGEAFNAVFEDGIVDPETDEPIASGPFMFDSWDRGQQVELVRNEDFSGELANLDRVVFRITPDINTQLQQLRGGEIDMMDPQVQLDLLAQVEEIDGIDYQTDAGPTWEHLDFQHTHPLLGQQFVREAIAHGINREGFIDEFIAPIDPDAEPLNSMVYVSNQDEYEDHFGEFVEYDPDRAMEILEENGCEQGDDGVYECDGERMEFDVTSTAGNERRELFFEFAQADLEQVGIQLNETFGDPATVFGADVLDAGDWDMFLFAWVGSPDPASNVELWGCFERTEDGGIDGPANPDEVEGLDDERYGNQNYHRYCPPEEVSQTLIDTRREIDPDARADLMNEAGAGLAEGIPILPIFQMPDFLAHREDLQGLQINTTQWGQVWNIGEWGLAE